MKPNVLLFPFSVFYGLAIVLRNWFFEIGILKSEDVGVPVISVGNITSGGTGKTPIVANIAGILLKEMHKVAVISRGYRRQSKGSVVVSDGKNILSTIEDSGDESLMLAGKFRDLVVIVDEDRVRGARKAVSDFKTEVIILDDGFQHRYLKRTTDIVLMDADNSPFQTTMIPSGYRREPLKGLRRANAVVVTKVTDGSLAQRLLNERMLQQIDRKFISFTSVAGLVNVLDGEIHSKEILQGRSVVSFCGIAKPESFQNTIAGLGATVIKSFRFNDHYNFTGDDIEHIIHSCKGQLADFIVTTEKDAARLQKHLHRFESIPLFAVQIEARFENDSEWKKFIIDSIA